MATDTTPPIGAKVLKEFVTQVDKSVPAEGGGKTRRVGKREVVGQGETL